MSCTAGAVIIIYQPLWYRVSVSLFPSRTHHSLFSESRYFLPGFASNRQILSLNSEGHYFLEGLVTFGTLTAYGRGIKSSTLSFSLQAT